MKDAAMAPPGVMPSQQPIADDLSSVTQYFGRSFHTLHTTRRLMLAAWPRSARRSSMVSRISLMPNEPDHGDQEVHAAQQVVRAEGHAQLARDGVHADACQQQPERHGDDGLVLVLLAQADEGTEGEEVHGEEFRRPELQREARDLRRKEGDQQDRHQRADEGRRERRRERLGRLALLRHRVAVEGGRDRPRFARDVEQDRGDRAAEQRPPVDAREHDDGGSRVHREGEREQDRHPVRPAEPGQHADEDAEREAHHHQGEDLPGEQYGKSVEQQVDGFQGAFPSVR